MSFDNKNNGVVFYLLLFHKVKGGKDSKQSSVSPAALKTLLSQENLETIMALLEGLQLHILCLTIAPYSDNKENLCAYCSQR